MIDATATTMTDDDAGAALLAEFAARADPLGVTVQRVGNTRDAATAVDALAAEWGADTVVVAAELGDAAPRLLAGFDQRGRPWQTPGTPRETSGAALGLSMAHLAVAETGSVLLNEPSLDDRTIGMLAAGQLVVCPTSALVPSLDDAAAVLRAIAMRPGGGYATLVTGPSRTADIERVLTVGVQGPARVAVLFIDNFG